MSGPCVFCRIVEGLELPAGSDGVLSDLGGTIVFRPKVPVVDGHVLIVPKVHVDDAGELPAVTGAAFADAARWGEHSTDAFNLITSAGRDATQTVRHLHVHFVPRLAGDGLLVPWGMLNDQDQTAPHCCRPLAELGRLWDQAHERGTDGPVDREVADALDRIGGRR